MKRGLWIGLGLMCAGGTVLGDLIFDWVTIDHPGNPPDHPYPDPWREEGRVDYVYQISRYEVTVAQYVEFLNWKAKSDPHGLWAEEMAGGAWGNWWTFHCARGGGGELQLHGGGGEGEPAGEVGEFL